MIGLIDLILASVVLVALIALGGLNAWNYSRAPFFPSDQPPPPPARKRKAP